MDKVREKAVYKEDEILYLLQYLDGADEREDLLLALLDIVRRENKILRKALKLP